MYSYIMSNEYFVCTYRYGLIHARGIIIIQCKDVQRYSQVFCIVPELNSLFLNLLPRTVQQNMTTLNCYSCAICAYKTQAIQLSVVHMYLWHFIDVSTPHIDHTKTITMISFPAYCGLFIRHCQYNKDHRSYGQNSTVMGTS